MKIDLFLRKPTQKQREIMSCGAKRVCVCGGRRGGKTVLSALVSVQAFLARRRVLYAAPTQDQSKKFWFEVNKMLYPLIRAKVVDRNLSAHYIEFPGTEARITAKTAWNPDILRSDYASLLIMDEFHLMDPDAWRVVGAPMLLDQDGDAYFIHTPPSFRTKLKCKHKDPMYATRMWKEHLGSTDPNSIWRSFHFSSLENPHVSRTALNTITSDMSALDYRAEILAEFIDEVPGALWSRAMLDKRRVSTHPPLKRKIVFVDPSASSTGDEAGIIAAGLGEDDRIYVIADESLRGSPKEWAMQAVGLYNKLKADRLLAESNQGGEMAAEVFKSIVGAPPVKLIHAHEGKYLRAEPVAVLTEHDRVRFVGMFPPLEDELCQWLPGSPRSPNRLDAFVHAVRELDGSRMKSKPDYSRGGVCHATIF